MTPDRLNEIAGALNVAARRGCNHHVVLFPGEVVELIELALDGMEANMQRNRDWAADFNQGNGRTCRDYGNMGRIEPMDDIRRPLEGAEILGMVMGSIVVMMMIFAWMLW